MGWFAKATALYGRYGGAIRFTTKLVLSNVLPAGSAVAELVDHGLALIQKSINQGQGQQADQEAQANRELKASPADLRRLEEIFDKLGGDLSPLMQQLAHLKDVP